MSILFSPIGTADPITQLGDGPMLHIVRHYNPNRIVLFLSPKMAAYQKADERYTRAIKDLVSFTGTRMPIVELIESSFEEVHRFDCYIQEFEQVLSSIRESNPDESILVNVSSGTPGMQSALVAIGAFGKYHANLLQVSTPRQDVNKRHDRENPDTYDYDTLWELNPDNEDGAVQRISLIETPNFGERLLREQAISLMKNYDYRAASNAIKDVSIVAPHAKDLIEAAAERLMLNQEFPAKVFSSSSLGQKDVCYRADKPLHEYISMLEVRLEQGHYADFVRALTPAITETIFTVIEPKIAKKSYLVDKSILNKDYRFDAEKINSDATLKKVFGEFLDLDRRDYLENKLYVQNWSLLKIADYYVDDVQVLRQLHKLFEFENGKPQRNDEKTKKGNKYHVRHKGGDGRLRNKLAHQIRKMDKDTIEDLGGMSLNEVMGILFDLNDVKPGLYKRINELILAEMMHNYADPLFG